MVKSIVVRNLNSCFLNGHEEAVHNFLYISTKRSGQVK